eukprot:jgi/Psemu1/29779/gm1.29779_g
MGKNLEKMMLERFKSEKNPNSTVSKDGGTVASSLAEEENEDDNYIDPVLMQLLGGMEESQHDPDKNHKMRTYSEFFQATARLRHHLWVFRSCRQHPAAGPTPGPLLSKTTASRVLLIGHHIAELEMIDTHKAFFIPFELVPLVFIKGLLYRKALEALSQVALRADELGIQPPLVSTAVLKRFQDCNFHRTNPYDVAGGILPLAFTPSGGSADTLKQEQEAAASVAAYGPMISTEGNSLTLKNSLELQRTKAYLESYLVVLVNILGATHTVVEGYQRGLLMLKKKQMPLQRAIADEVRERITLAIVVYYFQIRVRAWLEEQWESDITIPSPALGMIYILGSKPDPPQGAANGGYTGNNNFNNSNSGTQLQNPNCDAQFKDRCYPIVKKLDATKMQDAIATMRGKGKGPLMRLDGKERWHFWYIKGSCFSDCKHIYNHSAITPSEYNQELWEWCHRNMHDKLASATFAMATQELGKPHKQNTRVTLNDSIRPLYVPPQTPPPAAAATAGEPIPPTATTSMAPKLPAAQGASTLPRTKPLVTEISTLPRTEPRPPKIE